MTARATRFRTPRSEAVSGAWLEGLSKSEAQTFLVILPWFLLSACLVGSIVVAAIQTDSSMDKFAWVLHKILYLVSCVLCAIYLFFVVLEPFRCFCAGRRVCRSREGCCALLLVVLCLASSLLFFFSTEEDKARAFHLVRGSIPLRIASTLEFIMQLLWLFGAHHIRYTERLLPCWKKYGGCALFLLWLIVTFFDALFQAPTDLLTYFSVLGYSARWFVFMYCVMHTLKDFGRYCCHCIPVADWQDLESVPCSPGRQRLRHLAYYVMTRPNCLLAINLPLGYPLYFGCGFVSALRCGFSLLLAILIGPALYREAFEMHGLERDTKERFNIALAMRLCELSNETYYHAPRPRSVIISGCTSEFLNGEYERDLSSIDLMYKKSYSPTGVGDSCNPFQSEVANTAAITLFLRRTPQGEWEISKSPSHDPDSREAFVEDQAFVPNGITGEWVECSSQQNNANIEVKVSPSCFYTKRRFEFNGVCQNTQARWILVEEEDALDAPAKLSQFDDSNLKQDVNAGVLSNPDFVSIVVAFRGTENLQNLRTDLAFTTRSLSRPPEFVENCSENQSADPIPTVPEPIDYLKLEARLRYVQAQLPETVSMSTVYNDAAPSSSNVPDLGVSLTNNTAQTADVEDGMSLSGCLLNFLCCPFYCLWRILIGILFPCLPPSDFEDDDEEFSEDALERLRIHVGFADGYMALRSEILKLVRERLEIARGEGRRAQVFITGHSLGGALATIFALDFVSSVVPDFADLSMPTSDNLVRHCSDPMLASGFFVATRPIVYTFGCPRVGNAAFRNVYNMLVPETFRVVASRDVVPSVPPSIAYRHVGREVWLDDAGEPTYAMSWAMREILPRRDTLLHHLLTDSYYTRLAKAFRRSKKKWFVSAFQDEDFMRDQRSRAQ